MHLWLNGIDGINTCYMYTWQGLVLVSFEVGYDPRAGVNPLANERFSVPALKGHSVFHRVASYYLYFSCTILPHVIGTLAKLRKATVSSLCLYVRLSVWNNSAPSTDFHEIWY